MTHAPRPTHAGPSGTGDGGADSGPNGPVISHGWAYHVLWFVRRWVVTLWALGAVVFAPIEPWIAAVILIPALAADLWWVPRAYDLKVSDRTLHSIIRFGLVSKKSASHYVPKVEVMTLLLASAIIFVIAILSLLYNKSEEWCAYFRYFSISCFYLIGALIASMLSVVFILWSTFSKEIIKMQPIFAVSSEKYSVFPLFFKRPTRDALGFLVVESLVCGTLATSSYVFLYYLNFTEVLDYHSIFELCSGFGSSVLCAWFSGLCFWRIRLNSHIYAILQR